MVPYTEIYHQWTLGRLDWYLTWFHRESTFQTFINLRVTMTCFVYLQFLTRNFFAFPSFNQTLCQHAQKWNEGKFACINTLRHHVSHVCAFSPLVLCHQNFSTRSVLSNTRLHFVLLEEQTSFSSLPLDKVRSNEVDNWRNADVRHVSHTQTQT